MSNLAAGDGVAGAGDEVDDQLLYCLARGSRAGNRKCAGRWSASLDCGRREADRSGIWVVSGVVHVMHGKGAGNGISDCDRGAGESGIHRG